MNSKEKINIKTLFDNITRELLISLSKDKEFTKTMIDELEELAETKKIHREALITKIIELESGENANENSSIRN